MSFTYNGINSDDMGLFVERYPERPFPSRKQSVFNIHGRSGDIVIDEDAYSNVTQSYDVYIKGGSAGFQSKATAIANWLLGISGYANLSDSYDSTVYRKARFIGGVSFLNSLNKYGKATITFDCCPQRYPVTPEVLTETFGFTVTIPTVDGILPAYPLVILNNFKAGAAGTISTDDLTITFTALASNKSKIYIDFEKHTFIDNNGNAVSEFSASGKWGKLGNGDTITTHLTALVTPFPTYSVQTRRWYL